MKKSVGAHGFPTIVPHKAGVVVEKKKRHRGRGSNRQPLLIVNTDDDDNDVVDGSQMITGAPFLTDDLANEVKRAKREQRRRERAAPAPPPDETTEPFLLVDKEAATKEHQRQRRLREKQARSNYIGAGRPPSPAPPRRAPFASSSLQRPVAAGSRDALSVALPYSALFSDVALNCPREVLNLTGWRVHDEDLAVLAGCAWVEPRKPHGGGGGGVGGDDDGRAATSEHEGGVPTSARSAQSGRSFGSTTRSSGFSHHSSNFHAFAPPVLRRLVVADSPKVTLSGLLALHRGAYFAHHQPPELHQNRQQRPHHLDQDATAFNGLHHMHLRDCHSFLSLAQLDATSRPASAAAVTVAAQLNANANASLFSGSQQLPLPQSQQQQQEQQLFDIMGTGGGGGGGMDRKSENSAMSGEPTEEAKRQQREDRQKGKLLLKVFPALVSLHLEATAAADTPAACHLPDDALAPLVTSLRGLLRLEVVGSPLLGDEGLAAVTAAVGRRRQLTALNLSGCRRFGDEALLVLLQKGGGVLQEIVLDGCAQASDLGLFGMKARGHRSSLRKLHLADLSMATDASCSFMAEGFGRSVKEQKAFRKQRYLAKADARRRESKRRVEEAAAQRKAVEREARRQRREARRRAKAKKLADKAPRHHHHHHHDGDHYQASSSSSSDDDDDDDSFDPDKPYRFKSLSKVEDLTESPKKSSEARQKAKLRLRAEIVVYAQHGYGEAAKKRRRRALRDERKQHQHERGRGAGGARVGSGVEDLRLDGWRKLTDEGLGRLSFSGALESLTRLSLQRCTSVTAAAVASLLRCSPLLAALDLTGCIRVGDGLASAFAPGPTPLERFAMAVEAELPPLDEDEDDPLDDAGPADCRLRLCELRLGGLPRISDSALRTIVGGCPRLRLAVVSSDINALDQTRRTKVSHAGIGMVTGLVTAPATAPTTRTPKARVGPLGRPLQQQHLGTHLQRLDVSGAPGIDDAALFLLLSGTTLADAGYNEAAPVDLVPWKGRKNAARATTFRGMRKLKHLHIRWCNALSDVGCARALNSMLGHGGTQLETFEASGCSNLGDLTALSIALLMHEQLVVGRISVRKVRKILYGHMGGFGNRGGRDANGDDGEEWMVQDERLHKYTDDDDDKKDSGSLVSGSSIPRREDEHRQNLDEVVTALNDFIGDGDDSNEDLDLSEYMTEQANYTSLTWLSASGWMAITDFGLVLLLRACSRFDDDVDDKESGDDIDEAVTSTKFGKVLAQAQAGASGLGDAMSVVDAMAVKQIWLRRIMRAQDEGLLCGRSPRDEQSQGEAGGSWTGAIFRSSTPTVGAGGSSISSGGSGIGKNIAGGVGGEPSGGSGVLSCAVALSLREDREDFWNDWGKAIELERPANGGDEPTGVYESSSSRELPFAWRRQQGSDNDDFNDDDNDDDDGHVSQQWPTLLRVLPLDHTNSAHFEQATEGRRVMAAGTRHTGRLRRGRGRGVAGRFVRGGRPLPWFLPAGGHDLSPPELAKRLNCRLARLDLYGCSWLTNTAVAGLAAAAPATLRSVDLRDLDLVTDRGGGAAYSLACCKALEEVDFRGSGIGDDAARTLAKRLPRAQKVDRERRLEARPLSIRRFNEHVALLRRREAAAVCIQSYGRRRIFTAFVAEEKSLQTWASAHLQRLAKGFVARRLSRRRAEAGAYIRSWCADQLHKQHQRRWWQTEAALRAQHAAEKRAALQITTFRRGVKGRRVAALARRRRDRSLRNLETLVEGYRKKKHSELLWGMALNCQTIYRRCRRKTFDRRCEAGALVYQRVYRGSRGRRRAMVVAEGRWRLDQAASTLVQRRWRKKLFWRQVAAAARATAARKVLEGQTATRLQRWWVKKAARLHFLKAMEHHRHESRVATAIQAHYRGHLYRRRRGEIKARAIASWGFLCHSVQMQFKNQMATLIQRRHRVRTRARAEQRSAVRVQKVFRGHMARVECALQRYQIYEAKSTVVQGLWRRHRAKQLRLALVELRYRAAHAIQRCWRAYSLRKHLRDMMIRAQRKRAAEKHNLKEQRVEEKRRKALADLLQRVQDRAASQIQRQYRAHLKRKERAAEEQLELERALRAKLDEEERIARMRERRKAAKSVEGKTKRRVKALGDKFMIKKEKVVSVKDKIADAKKALGNSTFVKGSRWTGRTHPQEKKERDMMLDNAILNNHTRTSVTTGIVDVKVTVGSQDTQLFKEENRQLDLKKRPTWEQLPKDLSGPDKKQVYLWYLRGEGKAVLTNVELALAPPREERENHKKMESRYRSMRSSGTICAGHISLDFEVRGINIRKGGGSDPALDEIRAAFGSTYDQALIDDGYDKLNPALHKFNCGLKRHPCHIWIHVRRFPVKSKANELAHAVGSTFPWWTMGTQASVDKFALHIEDVVQLHDRVFREMDIGDDGTYENNIDVCEWREVLGEAHALHFDYLLLCTDCPSLEEMNFTHFLRCVATFCMFSKDELIRFLFGFACSSLLNKKLKEDTAAVTEEMFQEFVDRILEFEDIQFPHKKRILCWGRYCTPRDDLFWPDFQKLIIGTPLLLWPIQRLQVKIAKHCLGETFWLSQKAQMLKARQRLGIVRSLE